MRVYFYFPLARQTGLCHEVARYWQEARGWTGFAGVIVVSAGQPYQFMQQQREVTYQHLDSITDIERASLDYQITPAQVKAWEKRIECPLWHLVVADRNTGRMFVKGGRVLHTHFSNIADHEDIARLVCYYLDFYQKRLEAFRPDAVFFPVSAALHSLALVKVCQWMGIPFFTLRHTRVLDRYIVTHNDSTERFLAVEKRFLELLSMQGNPSPCEEAVRYFESFREDPDSPGYMAVLNKAQQKLRRKSLIRFWGGIAYRLVEAAWRWVHYRKVSKRDLRSSSPFEIWWLETQRLVGVRYSNLPHVEPSRVGSESYVYYPLHMNPEASTMILAPNFVNQLNVIEALAKNIPMTHKLYVKEHPAILGRRPRGFYKAIKEYPNVRLISEAENSMKLARNADLVTVITGTSGWEAILMGRPVITFGDAFYTALGMSEKCSDFSELGAQIRRLIYEDDCVWDQDRIMLFLSALFEESFPLSTQTVWQRDLQPGQLDDEAKAIAHNIAEHLAQAIESFHADQQKAAGV